VDELVELHRNGHEIGSHTVSHPLLSKLHAEGMRGEVALARGRLSEWLGGDVPGFCYPNGDFDARVVAAVARAGHSYACTTRSGIHRAGDDPFTIRRVDVVPDRTLDGARRFDETAFRRELCGLYRRARREPVGS
jgi:peptidoglycan/xylan/chitin deacetylase (PgdA/CDA1 family)